MSPQIDESLTERRGTTEEVQMEEVHQARPIRAVSNGFM